MSGTSRARIRWTYAMRTAEATAAAKKAIERALLDIGKQWKDAAQDRTPVRTGNLRSSLAWSTSTEKDVVTLVDGTVHTPTHAPAGMVHLGSNLPYALFVHEGVHAQTVTVRRHLVDAHSRVITQAFGKPIPPMVVQVRSHYRGPHPMNVPERAPNKFIQEPMMENVDRWRTMLLDALNSIQDGEA